MHEITFSQAQIWQTPSGNWLALNVDKNHLPMARRFVDGMSEGKPYTALLKRFSPKRSLDANAYFWVLCGKLAARLELSPNEVYRQYIPDVADNYVIFPVREDLIDKVSRMWCEGHTGRIAEDIGECRKTAGYHNLRCYIGSSDYDTVQMSRLINLVVDDCKQQGIETKTPQELAVMMAGWGDAQKN